MIHGITVLLGIKTQTGTDPFGKEQFTENFIPVKNVLVAPQATNEQVGTDPAELTGRRAVYQIAIPKGDTHSWYGSHVQIWGKTWTVTGEVRRGIDDMLPLAWNDIYQVEAIDG